MSDTLELNCWVLDDPFENVFPVKIPRTESIGTLKKVIKDENPDFGDIAARALDIWMVRCHLLTGIPTLTSAG
jgi:hypothetical protein